MDIDKTARALMEAMTPKEGQSGYDTTAEVTRVEGDTLWCHIPGGVDETPVTKTIDAEAGDEILIRVSGGRAWAVGNATAPPTEVLRKLKDTGLDAKFIKITNLDASEIKTGRMSADRLHGGTIDADDVTIKNLITDHLLSPLVSGDHTIKLEAYGAVLSLLYDAYTRLRLLQGGDSGWIQVFYGNVSGGTMNDADARECYITPTNIQIGLDKDGNFHGVLWCKDVYYSGAVRGEDVIFNSAGTRRIFNNNGSVDAILDKLYLPRTVGEGNQDMSQAIVGAERLVENNKIYVKYTRANGSTFNVQVYP